MTTVNIELLQSAIDSVNPEVGRWSLDDDDDRTQLLWIADLSDCPDDMYGDEPWEQWGGNNILEKLGQDISTLKAGIDGYVDQYGDDVVCHWVQWDKDSREIEQ